MVGSRYSRSIIIIIKLLIIIFVTIIIKNSSQRHSSLQFLLLLTENSQQPICMRTPTHTHHAFSNMSDSVIECLQSSPRCGWSVFRCLPTVILRISLRPPAKAVALPCRRSRWNSGFAVALDWPPFGRRSGSFHPFPMSHFFVFSHIFSFSLILPSWKRDVRSFSQQVGFIFGVFIFGWGNQASVAKKRACCSTQFCTHFAQISPVLSKISAHNLYFWPRTVRFVA